MHVSLPVTARLRLHSGPCEAAEKGLQQGHFRHALICHIAKIVEAVANKSISC